MTGSPSTPSTSSSPPSFHLALTVSNIKTFIPITLETDKVQYASWAELFKIHVTAFQVRDHIIPPRDESVDQDLWTRLDAIVQQWIYGTISSDLLQTILEPNFTAQKAWDRLKQLFQDNQHSRAICLQSQFSRLHQSNFTSVSAYCQQLKSLADQLANVGSPVSEQSLVLQLVAGLSEAYDGVATIIQQSDPLPKKFRARSMLTLEEARKANQVPQPDNSSPAALLASSRPQNHSPSPVQPHHQSHVQHQQPYEFFGFRGRGMRGHGRGYRGRGGRGFSYWPRPQGFYQSPWQQQQQWYSPPSPYPTMGYSAHNWIPRPPPT